MEYHRTFNVIVPSTGILTGFSHILHDDDVIKVDLRNIFFLFSLRALQAMHCDVAFYSIFSLFIILSTGVRFFSLLLPISMRLFLFFSALAPAISLITAVFVSRLAFENSSHIKFYTLTDRWPTQRRRRQQRPPILLALNQFIPYNLWLYAFRHAYDYFSICW